MARADDRLALELAGGATIVAAATAAGMSERSARRRLAEPEFQRRVVELRDQMVTAAVGRLTGAASAAADRLAGLIASPDERVALAACRDLLKLTIELRTVVELQREVDELRRAVEQMQQPPPIPEPFPTAAEPEPPANAGPAGVAALDDMVPLYGATSA